jgi:glycosyltransferase involved in cell wall biosynthesis
MHLGVDSRDAESPHPTGKGLWSKNVLKELNVRNAEVVTFGGTGGLLWHLQTARKLQRERLCDLYLSLTSYIVPWILGSSFPHAIVVHDLIAFERGSHDGKAKLIERLTLPRALRTTQYIFTVSETTKKELLTRFPQTDASKVAVICAGPTFQPSNLPTFQPSNSPHLLSIGTLCPRKNQLRLIQAFNALPADLRMSHTLILAGGRGWNDEEIVKLAEESENVEWRGYVPQEELMELLKNATVIAYPSLKEGFGLPVLDAMTAGVPILTSNRGSLKEIAGDAAALVNPESVEEMTQGLERLLRDETLRKKLAAKGTRRAEMFSWERTVDLLLEAIDN